MTTRIGIIGAGPNASGHGKYFAGCGRAKVVAVADPDRARADVLAKECGAKPVADYQEFLGDVDAVVVASPNFLHKDQAIACAKAGKHVYCEKPLGLSGADAREIAAAVRAAKVRSQVGFSVSFDPVIHDAISRVKSGEIGQLVSLNSRRLCWSNTETTTGWRADPARSGGLLFEINIHEIEWMMRCAGDVRQVYARAKASEGATHPMANDHLWITFDYVGGAVGTHEGSWRTAMPMFYKYIQGTTGAMCTNEWGNELYLARPGKNRDSLTGMKPFDLRANFLDAIAGTATSVADTDYGAKVMAVCDAIIESSRSGKPVAVVQGAAKG
jgi:predicted dehydrogenase